METEDLKIEDQMRDQLYSEQLPEVLEAYELVKAEISEKYSPEFVKDHPEVAASLTVALELKHLIYNIGEQREKQTSGIISTLHYLLDRDTNGTKIGS